MRKPRGTKDIFERKMEVRNYVITNIKNIAKIYNFKEIETPIFERSEVYVKSVGPTSNIVTKEMYTFKDKKDRSMTLRPEGTAGTLRAIAENKLANIGNKPLKIYYLGPMFRYESPQKGRQRQFTQFGIEMISQKSPFVDAEVILMAHTILKTLGIKNQLLINSLGDGDTIEKYSQALKKYLVKYKHKLSQDSLKKLTTNPLRILDDKENNQKKIFKKTPKISKFYSQESKEYFETLTKFLKTMNIPFKIDHTLVRGLDYYTDTTFEFVSKSKNVGTQNTIIGGGRYQNLLKHFGGPDKSGIGFGIGIERLVNDLEKIIDNQKLDNKIDVYVLNISPETQAATTKVVFMLRSAKFVVEWNQKPIKLQKAFAMAKDKQAHYNIIAGAKELSKGKVVVKHNNVQDVVKITKLVSFLNIDCKHKDK